MGKLIVNTDYTKKYDTTTRVLTISLTPTGIDKIIANVPNGKLITKFYTKINQTADLGEEIDNTAHLSFTNAVDQDYEKDSDTPEVHTGGIMMLKVDKENSGKSIEGCRIPGFCI